MESKQSIEATCPECRGPLSVIQENGRREYQCLVGHASSARNLLQAHSEVQERALWSAVVALEEAGTMVEAIAPELEPSYVKRLHAQAEQKERQALEIRKLLEQLEPFQSE